MRTTLDLDDRLVAAAKSRARAHRITLGQAVSELGLKAVGLEATAIPMVPGDFPVLPAVPGHVITDEMVAEALADD